MRWISRNVLMAASLLALPAAPVSASASANTTSVGQEIVIKATVLPARFVIINAQNQVLQIISNTSDTSITPTVYINSTRPENIRILTPEIKQQTETLLIGKTIKPGILYQRSPSPPAVYQKAVLPLLSVHK